MSATYAPLMIGDRAHSGSFSTNAPSDRVELESLTTTVGAVEYVLARLGSAPRMQLLLRMRRLWPRLSTLVVLLAVALSVTGLAQAGNTLPGGSEASADPCSSWASSQDGSQRQFRMGPSQATTDVEATESDGGEEDEDPDLGAGDLVALPGTFRSTTCPQASAWQRRSELDRVRDPFKSEGLPRGPPATR